MTRPLKYNAEYFSHDNSMRNDPRIRALRKKCGLQGYAIYNMILEYLSQSEFIQVRMTDLNIEIMAGDFDIEEKQMKDVLDCCVRLDLFQLKNNLLRCKQLDKRLEPVFSKRKLLLDDLRRKFGENSGQSDTETIRKPTENTQTVSETPVNPQSKVKERKGKERKALIESFDLFWSSYPKKIAKKKCLSYWRNHNLVEKVDKILSALGKYKKTQKWQDTQFIPYPYTWLNQERWEDEIPKDEPKKHSSTGIRRTEVYQRPADYYE